MKTEWIFWGSLSLVLYTYVGYPFLLSILSILNKLLSGPKRVPKRELAKPTVSVVLVAHNEEQRVLARIENLMQSDYGDLAEILLICDRSDDTGASAKEVMDASGIGQWVRVVEMEKGKDGRVAGLNQAVAIAKGDVVVFADIDQRFERDTISLLVAPFVDKKIGAVGGILEFEPVEEGTEESLDIGLELEKFIQEKESDIGSTIGCNRAVYAVSGDAYQAIREDTILDEGVIPMTIALAGYRVLFEPKAKAYVSRSLDHNINRASKVRSLAGNWQMLFRHPTRVMPWVNRLTWQLVSHTYLRLFGPALLIIAMLSNIMLLDKSWVYWLIFMGQWFCYAMGIAGLFKVYFPWKPVEALARISGGFLDFQRESVMGLIRWIQGVDNESEIESIPPD